MATATTTLEDIWTWANPEPLGDLVALPRSLLGPRATAANPRDFFQRLPPGLQNPRPRHLDPNSFWTFLERYLSPLTRCKSLQGPPGPWAVLERTEEPQTPSRSVGKWRQRQDKKRYAPAGGITTPQT
eukprot:5000070-Pyramimonas_sp.AAC.1